MALARFAMEQSPAARLTPPQSLYFEGDANAVPATQMTSSARKDGLKTCPNRVIAASQSSAITPRIVRC